jgi:ribosomal protein S18 acetylase RimI-like enzyme
MISYSPATDADLGNLAPWLVDVCQAPEHHCLHSWSGESARALASQLRKYLADGELLYLLGRQNDQLIAAMGCEFDEELGRGWLHGPHVRTRPWNRIATDLYRAVCGALPRKIARLDAYVNSKNERGIEFYRQEGFSRLAGFSHDYRLTPSRRPGSGAGSGEIFHESHRTAFIELYRRLFPNAYYSGARVLEMIGVSHQVFVAAENREVIGFVVAAVDDSHTVGEIQFLGIGESHRGRGYGRGLLLSAIDWLFDSAEVSEIGLNVHDELAGPRQLYESVGFVLRFTGIGLRLPDRTG